MICREKRYRVHSVLRENSWLPRYFSVSNIILNKTFLCHHIVNTNNFGAFQSTGGLLLNQPVIQTHSAQNENIATCVQYKVIVCVYMIATDSHWLPTDRTDIIEKRGRRKGGMRGEVKSRGEDPASFCPSLSFILSCLLSFHLPFPLYLQTPFQYKMKIKLPLHIRHGFPFSWISLYETLCITFLWQQ